MTVLADYDALDAQLMKEFKNHDARATALSNSDVHQMLSTEGTADNLMRKRRLLHRAYLHARDAPSPPPSPPKK